MSITKLRSPLSSATIPMTHANAAVLISAVAELDGDAALWLTMHRDQFHQHRVECRNPAHLLHYAFVWGETPQKGGYWVKLEMRLPGYVG